jgi:hypothetical protein
LNDERLPFAKIRVIVFTPDFVLLAFTVIVRVSSLPVSRVTMALKPATLLMALGRPEKLYPKIVTDVLRPIVRIPTSRSALGADEIVMVFIVVAAAYGDAAAFVAVTMHVPDVDALRAPPVIAHPVAVPFATV